MSRIFHLWVACVRKVTDFTPSYLQQNYDPTKEEKVSLVGHLSVHSLYLFSLPVSPTPLQLEYHLLLIPELTFLLSILIFPLLISYLRETGWPSLLLLVPQCQRSILTWKSVRKMGLISLMTLQTPL